MEYLVPGETVYINRSDGRVHLAEVVSKDDELQTVLVTWNEGFKRMGKETSWDCVVSLNPRLKDRCQTVHDDEKESSNSSEEEFFEFEPCYDKLTYKI